MCLERLIQLKCGHFEHHGADHCPAKLLEFCKECKFVVTKVEKLRSCAECKLVRGASMGFASPGLMKL